LLFIEHPHSLFARCDGDGPKELDLSGFALPDTPEYNTLSSIWNKGLSIYIGDYSCGWAKEETEKPAKIEKFFSVTINSCNYLWVNYITFHCFIDVYELFLILCESKKSMIDFPNVFTNGVSCFSNLKDLIHH
jgi:hypothetical protein